jgi:hypothetical protein
VEGYRLILTDEEETFVAEIDLYGRNPDRHQAYLDNQQPILRLLRSLVDRGGIPAHRLRYWDDPAYNSDRSKLSRNELFRRNGGDKESPFIHPNFIPHLRYILYGADLPASAMAQFKETVGDPEWVSYGDALELGKQARALVRRHGLQPNTASEEFFKLSLDLGLSADEAHRIRETVRTTR